MHPFGAWLRRFGVTLPQLHYATNTFLMQHLTKNKFYDPGQDAPTWGAPILPQIIVAVKHFVKINLLHNPGQYARKK